VSRAEIGEHQTAIADYTQAIALDPQFALAYHNRGLSYESLGDGKAAQVDYHKTADLYQQQGKISGDQYNLYRSKNSILRFLSSGSWSPGAYLYKAINKNNKLRNY
jgi:tetratricopeptide (TPR) repeat protein